MEVAARWRPEVTVAVRKPKRNDLIRKRRFSQVKVVPRGDPAPPKARRVTGEKGRVQELRSRIDDSTDLTKELEALRELRELVVGGADALAELVRLGVGRTLRRALRLREHGQVQLEAAWIISAISSSELSHALLEGDVLLLMVPLLRAANVRVREQAAWCFGNVAGDCEKCRDAVLELDGAVEGVLFNLLHPASVSMSRNLTWVAANLCRGNNPKPNPYTVAPFIPILAACVASNKDATTVEHACWALSYLSDSSESEVLGPLVRTGVCPALVRLLVADLSGATLQPCLRVLGNVVTGSEAETQAALDAGLLAAVVPLLAHPEVAVQREAAWAASNIAAGSRAQVAAMVAAPGMMEQLAAQMRDAPWAVRKEASWAMCNACLGGGPGVVRMLADRFDLVRLLTDMLHCDDLGMISVALCALDTVLAVGAAAYSIRAEETGALERVRSLEMHPDVDVRAAARDLLEDHFADTDTEPSSGEEDNDEDEGAAGRDSLFEGGLGSDKTHIFCFWSDQETEALSKMQ